MRTIRACLAPGADKEEGGATLAKGVLAVGAQSQQQYTNGQYDGSESSIAIGAIGSRLLQALIQQPGSLAASLLQSASNLSADEILHLSRNPVGSRAIEAILSSAGGGAGSGGPARQKLAEGVGLHAARLSRDKCGSHVLSAAYKILPVDGRAKVLECLQPMEKELKSSAHGNGLLKRLRYDHWRQHPESWKKGEQRARTAVNSFAEILAEEPSEEGKAGKKGKKAKGGGSAEAKREGVAAAASPNRPQLEMTDEKDLDDIFNNAESSVAASSSAVAPPPAARPVAAKPPPPPTSSSTKAMAAASTTGKASSKRKAAGMIEFEAATTKEMPATTTTTRPKEQPPAATKPVVPAAPAVAKPPPPAKPTVAWPPPLPSKGQRKAEQQPPSAGAKRAANADAEEGGGKRRKKKGGAGEEGGGGGGGGMSRPRGAAGGNAHGRCCGSWSEEEEEVLDGVESESEKVLKGARHATKFFVTSMPLYATWGSPSSFACDCSCATRGLVDRHPTVTSFADALLKELRHISESDEPCAACATIEHFRTIVRSRKSAAHALRRVAHAHAAEHGPCEHYSCVGLHAWRVVRVSTLVTDLADLSACDSESARSERELMRRCAAEDAPFAHFQLYHAAVKHPKTYSGPQFWGLALDEPRQSSCDLSLNSLAPSLKRYHQVSSANRREQWR